MIKRNRSGWGSAGSDPETHSPASKEPGVQWGGVVADSQSVTTERGPWPGTGLGGSGQWGAVQRQDQQCQRAMGEQGGEGEGSGEKHSDGQLSHQGARWAGGGLWDTAHHLDPRSARGPTLFCSGLLGELCFACPSDTCCAGSQSWGCRSRHHSHPLAVARVTVL